MYTRTWFTKIWVCAKFESKLSPVSLSRFSTQRCCCTTLLRDDLTNRDIVWKNVVFWKNQFCFRPWQDSNLQSSDPKSDALSIRPHGHIYGMCKHKYKKQSLYFYLIYDSYFFLLRGIQFYQENSKQWSIDAYFSPTSEHHILSCVHLQSFIKWLLVMCCVRDSLSFLLSQCRDGRPDPPLYREEPPWRDTCRPSSHTLHTGSCGIQRATHTFHLCFLHEEVFLYLILPQDAEWNTQSTTNF